MCRKLNKELPGLDMPPFPGRKGEEIFNNIYISIVVIQPEYNKYIKHVIKMGNKCYI